MRRYPLHRQHRLRLPHRSAGKPRQPVATSLAGLDVVLAAHFSAKAKSQVTLVEAVACPVLANGARAVATFIQRRGVSDGGVARMNLPLSDRTLFSAGKVREIAETCDAADAGAVVTYNRLTDRQRRALRRALRQAFGCPVLCWDEVDNS